MNSRIVTISDRGQITIPASVRKKIKSQHISFSEKDGYIILMPVQTRDEFLEELDRREEEYDATKQGTTLTEMREELNL